MGVTVVDGGLNIAVPSEHATLIEFCLFDSDGAAELDRVALPVRTGDVWHGFFPGVGVGAVYGFRVHGPWQPSAGHFFNPNKVIVDAQVKSVLPFLNLQTSHKAPARGEP